MSIAVHYQLQELTAGSTYRSIVSFEMDGYRYFFLEVREVNGGLALTQIDLSKGLPTDSRLAHSLGLDSPHDPDRAEFP